MATNTTIKSATSTVTAVGHLQAVMKQLGIEMGYLKNSYRAANYTFNVEQSILDLQILVLNDVIRSASVQYHRNDNLVLEHKYVVSEEPIETWGVPAEETPLADIPDGLTVRFVVEKNPRQDAAYVDEWLDRLGYHACELLRIPAGAVSATYGAFASGGFGMTRTQIVDPNCIGRRGYGQSDLAMKETN